MQNRVNLKLGEVNNLTDARYAAGVGAKFIGFNLSPENPRYISPSDVQEIIGWVQGPCIVCEWDEALTDVITDTKERLQSDYVQLNSFNPEQAAALKDHCLIQNIIIGPDEHIGDIINRMDQIHQYTNFFMLSFQSDEVQEKFLSQPSCELFLLDVCRDFPMMFNFSFSPENLLPLVEKFSPFGINLKGSKEVRPGYKDFDSLNELVDLLELN